ncbi:tetratricopeptide repeat protein [Desulforhopalus sp. 52FAK]
MSKLYDVITRLEDVASQEETGQDAQAPQISEATERVRSPWLRLVVITLLIIVFGIVLIGATAWLQQWFSGNVSFPSADQPIKEVLTDPKPTPPAIETDITPSVTGDSSQPRASQQTVKLITEDFQGVMSIDVATQTLSVESLDQLIESDIFGISNFLDSPKASKFTIFIHDLDIAEAVNEDFNEAETTEPLYSPKNTSIDDIKAKSSKWLHQAELYRYEQEWEGAIILYQRVWEISKNPDVANNLAAALIEVNRVDEAHIILKETSAAAPHDPDIQQNLRIVEQILGQ